MKVEEYEALIFDFDGVVVDSNNFKKQCIYDATLDFFNEQVSREFTRYFTQNNGVPREKKIFDYFEDEVTAKNLLKTYNSLLDKGLKESVELTEGFVDFVNKYKNKTKFIVSGGTENEVIEVIKYKKLSSFFREIKGGPKSKYENIKSIDISFPCLYVGDSLIDYEVANHFGFDFFFMIQYTQFDNWKSFFSKKKETKIIKNFKDIIG